MRCVVLKFDVGDDFKPNEIKLNQEITQLKEQQTTQAIRLSDLEKQLLEEKTRMEKLEAINQELKSTVNQQSEKMKLIQYSNFQL